MATTIVYHYHYLLELMCINAYIYIYIYIHGCRTNLNWSKNGGYPIYGNFERENEDEPLEFEVPYANAVRCMKPEGDLQQRFEVSKK